MATDQTMNLGDDAVSLFPALNPGTHLFNDAGKFVTQDDRRKIGMVIVIDLEIASADSSHLDPKENVSFFDPEERGNPSVQSDPFPFAFLTSAFIL